MAIVVVEANAIIIVNFGTLETFLAELLLPTRVPKDNGLHAPGILGKLPGQSFPFSQLWGQRNQAELVGEGQLLLEISAEWPTQGSAKHLQINF